MMSFLENLKPHNQLLTSIELSRQFKGQVHCFSMQVVVNKCFLLNLEKKFDVDSSCHFQEKRKKMHL